MTCRLTVKSGTTVRLRLRGKVVATAKVRKGAKSVSFRIRRAVKAGTYTLQATRGKAKTTVTATLKRTT